MVTYTVQSVLTWDNNGHTFSHPFTVWSPDTMYAKGPKRTTLFGSKIKSVYLDNSMKQHKITVRQVN